MTSKDKAGSDRHRKSDHRSLNVNGQRPLYENVQSEPAVIFYPNPYYGSEEIESPKVDDQSSEDHDQPMIAFTQNPYYGLSKDLDLPGP